MSAVTILARLRRRTQIAPTNFDLCHATLISDYARQCYGGSSTPIFLRFPARRRALGILHLEPVRRSSRDIARVLALRHDAFKAELPCVLEHGCAIAVTPIDPFVQHQPRLHVGNQPVEIDLALKIGAKVVSHGRYVVFQMAEVAIPRQMFQEILRLIAELRPQPPPAPA